MISISIRGWIAINLLAVNYIMLSNSALFNGTAQGLALCDLQPAPRQTRAGISSSLYFFAFESQPSIKCQTHVFWRRTALTNLNDKYIWAIDNGSTLHHKRYTENLGLSCH